MLEFSVMTHLDDIEKLEVQRAQGLVVYEQCQNLYTTLHPEKSDLCDASGYNRGDCHARSKE